MKTASEPISNTLLRQAREEHNWTQENVAEKIGTTARNVSRWERGTTSPSPYFRQMLCELFKMTLEELGIRAVKSSTAPTNLPMSLPRLIGRDEAIAEVCNLLRNRDLRLLTLTGAPGIGKTQLAFRVAHRLLDDSDRAFDDGIFFVLLDEINEKDKDTIVATIVQQIGLKGTRGLPPLDRLKTYLRNKRLLLVLDNCEHLIQPYAELAKTLLENYGKLTILATSTERLDIVDSEEFWYVPPLSYPDDLERLPCIEDLMKYEAVQLFVIHRRKIERRFSITDKNEYAVAQICAHMEGHPLFIRLAAGIDHLSVQEIAKKLDNCPALLIGGSIADVKRHESLRGVMGWFYDLLSKPEQILLQRLSVFKGGWTPEAVEVICTGEDLPADTIHDLLLQLTRKSLIESRKQGGGDRNRLLETIRQYAYEQLRQAGKVEDIHRQHRKFFLQIAEESKQKLRIALTPEFEACCNSLSAEHENILVALDWCLKEQDSGETLLRLVTGLWWLWFTRWSPMEARHWLAVALEQADEKRPTRAYAEASFAAGIFAYLKCDQGQALLLFEKSMTTYRELDDESSAKKIQVLLTLLDDEKATGTELKRQFEETISIYPQIDSEVFVGMLFFNRSLCLLSRQMHMRKESEKTSKD
ncbi:MAG: helix-turn-helix domain-containing protein [Ktedonobacteraceae bacterium]